ncbi:ABC transporter ATP-binding protein [uncultured Pseudodesulfovibrio sp.]|uniref:ABC transporter ATP-binding protein n=1 Tax=uncultured Pseudodesulfovibrio sp. TaxID=2035858 RepID=UPI0029C9599D|nr:ABC transporter ATP-binding protein [uncultured Pseudodesulfovibrio sp.]
MLQLKDVNVFRGNTHVLHGVSLEVGEGEIVALIGANGAGKTTTLRAVSGLLPTREGSITYRPDAGAAPLELHSMQAESIVATGLCQCPEGRGIFGGLSVIENLHMGAYLRDDKQGILEDLEKIHTMFPILADRARQTAGTLSGGEQMMLALGRSLMSRPKLLMLDEPSLGLAPLVVESIFEMLADINRQGVTVLLVEQNAVMALELAHRAYVLENGVVTMSGTGAELANDDNVRKAYLGG